VTPPSGQSGEGTGSYYSTNQTRDLNKQFGDIWHKILDYESAILHDLQKRVVVRN
jgi:hypothetical protein